MNEVAEIPVIDVSDDVSAAVGGEGEGKSGGVRLRGPWSKEEDAVLCDLVSKYGPRNWNLIAKAIPPRSGKSCRLRWYNQLDPAIKRKPFTDEEDRIIIAAHAVHKNKWASIAKLLPGRTDNAIKNHWNSKLRHKFLELGRLEPISQSKLEDGSPERTKALSEETLSEGELITRPPELIHGSVTEYRHVESEDKAQKEDFFCISKKDKPILSRPVVHIGPFNSYSPQNSSGASSVLPKVVPMQGPLLQASKPYSGICGTTGACGDRMVPARCGYGCSASRIGAYKQSMLLVPEFADYEELPPISSQEFVATASDLNNIAWIRSGLENVGAKNFEKTTSHRVSEDATVQKHFSGRIMNYDHHRFVEGQDNVMGMRKDTAIFPIHQSVPFTA